MAGEADAPTFTVTVGEEEHTVPVPEGWVTADQLADEYMPKSAFETTLSKRVKSITKGKVNRADLLTDETFLTEVLDIDENKERAYEVLGVKPGEPPKEVDVAELRKKIEADVLTSMQDAEIKPRDTQIASLTERVGVMTERDFRASFIRAALEVGIHDEMIDPLSTFYRSKFAFDAESDNWFKLKPDLEPGTDLEFEVNVNPEKDGPTYKTILVTLAEERRGGEHKTWFKAEIPGGGDFQGPGGRRTTVTYEAWQAMSGVERRKLREENKELYDAFMRKQEEEGLKKLSGMGVAS